MDVNFILKHNSIPRSSFDSMPHPVTPSRRDGCGNNAYWVKTNLYTNLQKFPTIPPVRPPCTSAGNAPWCSHTGNMYGSTTVQAMHRPCAILAGWLAGTITAPAPIGLQRPVRAHVVVIQLPGPLADAIPRRFSYCLWLLTENALRRRRK